MKTTVDLLLVAEIIADAAKVIDDLNGVIIDDPDNKNRAVEAKINRELLNLADQLTLAASLVRNEYWTSKGELLSYEIA